MSASTGRRRLRHTAARERRSRQERRMRVRAASVECADDRCGICLTSREDMVFRGKLPLCEHLFCHTCIICWSKTTNTCPLCKQRFRAVTRITMPGATTANVTEAREGSGPPPKIFVRDRGGPGGGAHHGNSSLSSDSRSRFAETHDMEWQRPAPPRSVPCGWQHRPKSTLHRVSA